MTRTFTCMMLLKFHVHKQPFRLHAVDAAGIVNLIDNRESGFTSMILLRLHVLEQHFGLHAIDAAGIVDPTNVPHVQ
eukprot:40405-Eustigmatos_ZCMA.PRE.1